MAATTTSRKRFQTVLVFVAVCALTSACLPGWKEWNGSCYILLSSKKNRQDAEEACKQLGVNMIVPNSQREYDYIWEEMTKWMKRNGAVTANDLQLWIGCMDVDNTGKMSCQGGQDNPGYANWGAGEPNEPCHGCIRMTGSYKGRLGDRGCDNTYFVACEMKLPEMLPGTCPAPPPALYIHVPDGLCLLNHQIKTYPVKDPIRCGLACWAEPRCYSFNLLKQLDETIYCQLNNATRLQADVTNISFVEKCYFYEP